MRTIKFRGRVINRKAAVGNEAEIGDIVKGSLIIYEDEPAHHRCWIKRQEKNHTHIDYPVDPDSVAQLVGYDRNGNEVYEGDEIISVHGVTATATFLGNLLAGDTLKEADDNGGA